MFFLAFVVLSVMTAGIVSAQSGIVQQIQDIGGGLLDVFRPLFGALLGDVPGGDLLFAKVLLLTIILAIVWVILERFDVLSDRPFVITVIALAVSVLGVRFIGDAEVVRGIILPFSGLAIAISVLLPLAIYFYFVERIIPTSFIRKIAWIVAAVVFAGLWVSRLDELGDVSWWYGIAVAACILFLFIDGTIQKAFRKAKFAELREVHGAEMRPKITAMRKELEGHRIEGTITDEDYRRQDRRIKKLEKRYIS